MHRRCERPRAMETEKLRIRRYEDADRDAVWALHERAMGAAGTLAHGPWNDDMRDIENVYFHDGGDFLIGEVRGRVVAMGGLKRISDTQVELKRLRVDPEHQRAGYGGAMFDAMLERAMELGYVRATLDTAVSQVHVQRMVIEKGFHEVERMDLGPIPSILYAKRL